MKATRETETLGVDESASDRGEPTIVSIERALKALRVIADEPSGLGTRELARRIGVHPGTAQKILNTLRNYDFVTRTTDTARYQLGPTIARLSNSASTHFDILAAAKPVLLHLATQTGESAMLGVRRGGSCEYIGKVLSSQAVRMDIPLNTPRPLNSTATGKILLAFEPSVRLATLQEMAAEGLFEAPTRNSILDPGTLFSELQDVRDEGIAYDRREYVVDGVCVAAPVFGPGPAIMAAITISGPAERMEPKMPQLHHELLAAASTLSQAIGGDFAREKRG